MDTIDYYLAAIDSPNISGVRKLSEHEYFKIYENIRLLEKFSKDEDLYNIIELNHEDLLQRVEFYKNRFSKDQQMGFELITNQFMDLNRLILNLLSSIRTYLDHTETKIKRENTIHSEEYKLFKRLTTESFDNNFSYRFLAKLRNYSQHCGLPSGSLNIHSEVDEQTLTIFIDRDNLLNDYNSWGVIVTNELKKQPEKFDILPLIEQKVEILKKINNHLSENNLSKLTEEGKNLLDLISEVIKQDKGVPMLLKTSGEIDNPEITIKWFPYAMISRTNGVTLEVNEIIYKP